MNNINHSKLKVLHVDDDISFLADFKNAYGDWFVINSVDSLETALEMLDKQSFSVVVSNYHLPHIEGDQILKSIKMKDSLLPVIFYSSTANEELIRQAFVSGADDFFIKELLNDSSHIKRFFNILQKACEKYKIQKTHKEIEERNTLLTMAVEQANECVIITDKNHCIKYINPVTEKVTGYTKEELLGKSPKILKSGQHSKEHYDEMKSYILKGKPWRGRFVNKRKDGSLYEEDAIISPLIDENGNINSYVAVKRDITEQIKLEKRLQQAQKLEAVGTLAGGIAHDFNNILGAIIGFTQLSLDDVEEDSDIKENLMEVLQACHRAKDLVKQILAFSRQTEQEVTQVQISLIIKEVVKLLRATLPSTISINVNISRHSSIIKADSTQIHQVLMNLCTNAFHAMKDTGGVLTISLTEVTLQGNAVKKYDEIKEGTYVQLTVEDTGHGMTQDIVDRIFDPYFTTKNIGEGTGLGLAVVHGIIKNLKGDIKIISALGKGTTVVVLLPKPPVSEPALTKEVESTLQGTEKIMFVDDEEVIVRMAKKMLTKLGYTVVGLCSSLKALEMFKNEPDCCDILITDQTMPDLTGTQLTKEMHKIRPDLPIVLCTGYSDLIKKNTPENIGVDAVILKPVTRDNISKVIREVMDKK